MPVRTVDVVDSSLLPEWLSRSSPQHEPSKSLLAKNKHVHITSYIYI